MKCWLKEFGLMCNAITFSLSLLSQTKGVVALSISNKQLPTNHTYAVVVGISDYQDPAIPDLRFADKDAEALANYLRLNGGGNLDKNKLKIVPK